MLPKMIGIVGGAGPLAGAALLENIFRYSQTTYGCCRDSDFPQVALLSFPFSDMLSSEVNPRQIQNELQTCLKRLRLQGASILAIACNTLHAFLDENDTGEDLVHLPKTLGRELITLTSSPPLILCTTTAARSTLHKRFFPCTYLEEKEQMRLDGIIQQILSGEKKEETLQMLVELIKSQEAHTLILGCTDLSLFTSLLIPRVKEKSLIDPLEILAKKIVEKSFVRRNDDAP